MVIELDPRVYSMQRLERLKIIVLVPDADSRSTLRDALAAIVFRGDVRTVRRFEDAQALLEEPEPFDVIFFASAFGSEDLKRFISQVASSPRSSNAALVLAVDRHTSNKLESVVQTYLGGVDGFISEPYTSEQLQELLLKILDPARERVIQTKTRVYKSVDLLARQAVSLIDDMWRFRLEGGKGGGASFGELKRVSGSLKDLADKYPQEYLESLAQVFESAEPPDPEYFKRKGSTHAKKAEHPGRIVRSLMDQRGLSRERLLASVRISPEEFDALLSGSLGLNDALAREIARVLGKTAREWMAMQRAYDLSNPRPKEEVSS